MKRLKKGKPPSYLKMSESSFTVGHFHNNTNKHGKKQQIINTKYVINCKTLK